jgi:hypothetical protein
MFNNANTPNQKKKKSEKSTFWGLSISANFKSDRGNEGQNDYKFNEMNGD